MKAKCIRGQYAGKIMDFREMPGISLVGEYEYVQIIENAYNITTNLEREVIEPNKTFVRLIYQDFLSSYNLVGGLFWYENGRITIAGEQYSTVAVTPVKLEVGTPFIIVNHIDSDLSSNFVNGIPRTISRIDEDKIYFISRGRELEVKPVNMQLINPEIEAGDYISHMGETWRVRLVDECVHIIGYHIPKEEAKLYRKNKKKELTREMVCDLDDSLMFEGKFRVIGRPYSNSLNIEVVTIENDLISTTVPTYSLHEYVLEGTYLFLPREHSRYLGLSGEPYTLNGFVKYRHPKTKSIVLASGKNTTSIRGYLFPEVKIKELREIFGSRYRLAKVDKKLDIYAFVIKRRELKNRQKLEQI